MEGMQSGPPGLSVVSHVVMELNSVIDHVPIHRLQTMEHHAQDLIKRHGYVPLKYAQHHRQHQVNIPINIKSFISKTTVL